VSARRRRYVDRPFRAAIGRWEVHLRRSGAPHPRGILRTAGNFKARRRRPRFTIECRSQDFLRKSRRCASIGHGTAYAIVDDMRVLDSFRSIRASGRERVSTLAGDSIVPFPRQSLTYAITVACPPHEVWPWLAQMGSGGRAGWYSYDRLDNAGRHSADHIHSRWQDVTLGSTFPPLPGIENMRLVDFEREANMVLAWGPQRDLPPTISWAFVLEPRRAGETRLIARARATYGTTAQAVPFWMTWPLVHLGHFLMQRKQLLGIAMRAERVTSPGRQPLGRDAA